MDKEDLGFMYTEDLRPGDVIEQANIHWFLERIYYTRDESHLSQKILQERLDLGMQKQLAGDIKEEFSVGPNFKYLDDVRGTIHRHLEVICSRPIEEIYFCYQEDKDVFDLWVNIMKTGEHNPQHRHAGIFSFVWYLDVPEVIRHEHENQLGNVSSRGIIEFPATYSANSIRIQPRTDDILIFNANQPHLVYPFYTEGVDRISMAGNIAAIKFKDGSYVEMEGFQGKLV